MLRGLNFIDHSDSRFGIYTSRIHPEFFINVISHHNLQFNKGCLVHNYDVQKHRFQNESYHILKPLGTLNFFLFQIFFRISTQNYNDSGTFYTVYCLSESAGKVSKVYLFYFHFFIINLLFSTLFWGK